MILMFGEAFYKFPIVIPTPNNTLFVYFISFIKILVKV